MVWLAKLGDFRCSNVHRSNGWPRNKGNDRRKNKQAIIFKVNCFWYWIHSALWSLCLCVVTTQRTKDDVLLQMLTHFKKLPSFRLLFVRRFFFLLPFFLFGICFCCFFLFWQKLAQKLFVLIIFIDVECALCSPNLLLDAVFYYYCHQHCDCGLLTCNLHNTRF